MTAPDERKFKIFRKGQVRDTILISWRNSLRNLTNPDTNLPFTEDQIQIATQPGSRFFIEADAIDVVGMANQSRALFFANQTDPGKANTDFLQRQHGRLWLGPDSVLPATGSSGFADTLATPGSIFTGSTTVPDPAAAVAVDESGNRFQVFQTVVATGPPAAGQVSVRVELRAINTGSSTNVVAGTTLKWSENAPLGAAPTATIVSVNPSAPNDGMTGGFNVETDAEYATRIEERYRFRPASGNPAHFLAWARQATVATEAAFIYSTALNSGSVLVAITEKRSTVILEGPLARQPSIGTLTDVQNFIVPPNSPVVPNRVFVLATGWNEEPSDLVVSIAMAQGSVGGWQDVEPWPTPSAVITTHSIASVTSQTEFTFNVDVSMPGGATFLSGDDAPAIIIWDETTSRFVDLSILDITVAAGIATVRLTIQPSSPEPTVGLFTLAVGQPISPATEQDQIIALSFEEFFDSLGPGEVIDLSTSAVGVRGFRFPQPSDSFPQRAGQIIIPFLIDALGGVASSANLDSVSVETPDLPGSISDGPNMVTLGKVSIYPL